MGTVTTIVVLGCVFLVFAVLVGLVRLVKKFPRSGLILTCALAYLIFCGLIAADRPSVGVVLLALGVVGVVIYSVMKNHKPEHQPESFKPAPPVPVAPPRPKPTLLPHQIRAIEVVEAFPNIANACDLAVRDTELSDEYRESFHDANRRGDGSFLDRVASVASTISANAIKNQPGVMTRATGIYRVPVVVDLRPTEDVTTLVLALPHGMRLADVESAIPALTLAYRAHAVRFEQQPQDVANGVIRLHILHADPLRNLGDLKAAPTFDGNWKALPVGMRTSGEVATIRLENVSGIVVGGLPGSGKTASIMGGMGALAWRNDVQFDVVDGKGSHDWDWIERRALSFQRDDEDREGVTTHLEQLVDVMKYRLDHMPELRNGDVNFWEHGPSVDLPLRVIIIDECHVFLDKEEIDSGDKEAMAFRNRCQAAIARLVRLGRSAGMLVILMTQKPTSDSIPTKIGGNTTIQIAFRLKTSQAEQAVFGGGLGEGDPSATSDLPDDYGYAVFSNEKGKREVMRFWHVPQEVLHEIGMQTSLARREETMDVKGD